MRAYDIIDKKKNNIPLSPAEILYIVDGYISGEIQDYQMSAFLMAVYFNGMSFRELYSFTECMRISGEIFDLSKVHGKKIDKHSTGGVGDKTTLVVAPLVAACGGKVAKMSGRGLGFTGGTIDKLEAIPGFKTDISEEKFIKILNTIGVSVMGQTKNIVPADKKIYALRDVTATVDSIPLIASSVMSKKLASGSDKIVLEVTVGSGAFMKDLEQARILARTMVDIGKTFNKQTIAILTNMDTPLGNAVGNNLEVVEAIEVLNGGGPEDVKELCKVLAECMIEDDITKLYQNALKDSLTDGFEINSSEFSLESLGISTEINYFDSLKKSTINYSDSDEPAFIDENDLEMAYERAVSNYESNTKNDADDSDMIDMEIADNSILTGGANYDDDETLNLGSDLLSATSTLSDSTNESNDDSSSSNVEGGSIWDKITSGEALKVFAKMVELQGGDPDYIYHPEKFEKAPIIHEVISENEGYITSMDTELCGKCAGVLGAGREFLHSEIDPKAGIIFKKKTGDFVTKGDVLMELHTSDEDKLDNALELVPDIYKFGVIPPEKKPVVLGIVE
ncbi:MAG: thymidine phosphorylase [Lachnospiraceae bacterium]|nr:thymidine phosphorylase [Lachnospiraceae bacterium]